MFKSAERTFRSFQRLPVVRHLGETYLRWVINNIGRSGFFESQPVLIVGCGHSGTSLLHARLSDHKDLIPIPGESRLFALDNFRKARELRRWNDFWTGDRNLLEKTPIHVRFLDDIKRLFLHARIIGITRDPLDTVASLAKRHDEQLGRAISRYNRDSLLLRRAVRKQQLSILLRYEDVIHDPEASFVSLQKALGLKVIGDLHLSKSDKVSWYSRGSLTSALGRHETPHRNKRERQINRPIFDGRGSFKKQLTDAQIKTVIRATWENARQFGYGDSPENRVVQCL